MVKSIITNKNKMRGVPYYQGTNITVANVIGMFAQGYTEGDINEIYLDLSLEDIRAGLFYASAILSKSQIRKIENIWESNVSISKLYMICKIVAVVILLVGLIFFCLYFIYFGLLTSPMLRLSTEHSDWGTFGDYLGGTLNPLLSLVNLLAIFALAIFVFNLETNRNTKENTFKIIQEWDSESMRMSRNIAHEFFVMDKFNPRHKKIKQPPFSSHDAKTRFDMNKILEFYDRLNVLRNNDMIVENIIKEYFTSDYIQWYYNYFEKQKNIESDPEYKIAFDKHPYAWLM